MRIWLSLVVLVFSGAFSHAQTGKSGTIKVTLEGVLDGQGQLRVALEKSAKDFDSGSFETPKYLSRVEDAKGESVNVVFPAVPYGTYAIKVFQDLDGDGKLKTGFMGAPEEPWGFSNDATGFMGPADFSDAKFELDSSELELTIHLKK
jgi:uncharacterized protein (DUF2141 family)